MHKITNMTGGYFSGIIMKFMHRFVHPQCALLLDVWSKVFDEDDTSDFYISILHQHVLVPLQL